MVDYTLPCNEPFLFIDGDVFIDYLEFSGEDDDAVLEKIQNFKLYTKSEYHAMASTFYTDSHMYIYDILGGNSHLAGRANLLNRFIPNVIKLIKDHPGTTFADFGGGIGAMCSIVHSLGTKTVTHIDIPSRLMDFAKFRYTKHQQSVNIVSIASDHFVLPQRYDIIFSDAVWEHLTPTQQIEYASTLVRDYLYDAGYFILLIDLSGEDADMPMHFNVDIHAVHDALTKEGMTCQQGLYTFASLWVK